MPTSVESQILQAERRPADLRRFCGTVGLGAAAVAVLASFFSPAGFFQAYLVAALACLGPAMGCLPLIFIYRMTGGRWARTLAPALVAGSRMAPWTLLLFVPMFFGLRHLFPWAAPGTLTPQAQAMLAKHATYFGPVALILRWLGYLVSCVILLRLARWRKAAWTGPVGMMLYVVTAYLLGVDWVMSLEPGWSSTGFPVIFMAGQVLSALAFCIVATWFFASPDKPGSRPAPVWKDLGNLLLGVLMFWAYVGYAQFIVVWSGDLPEEAKWYVHRNTGGWHALLIGLAVTQLFIPVLLLLSNAIKRRSSAFAALAFWVLVGQAVYGAWSVLPSFRPNGIGFHPLDFLLPLALDGLWLFGFLGFLPPNPEESTEI